jgi:23S rRNA A2030 N6-methylase RlmJ
VVINPPYGFGAEMDAALPWLAPRLALEPGHGQELSWLKREEELR